MKITIIANPIAGGGSAYEAVRRYVRNWKHPDWEVEIMETSRAGHAGLLAQELLKRPPDLLAVCGGDGTINEIASDIYNPPFPIAILPAGTANVLARELKLPLDPVKALGIALKHSVRPIDLGVLSNGTTRRFLFAAGTGFDAYVVSKVPANLKRKLGMAAFAITIINCLRTYSFPEFQLTIEGQTFTATSCLTANAKSYGGGLLFTPNADMTDGILDVLVIQGRRRLELARFLLLAWLGKPQTREWIHRLRSRKFRIEGPADLLVQTDGELAGTLPVEISVAPSAIKLVVP